MYTAIFRTSRLRDEKELRDEDSNDEVIDLVSSDEEEEFTGETRL